MVRHKNRYIVVQINVSTSSSSSQEDPRNQPPLEDVTSHNVHNAIVSKVDQLHGDFGVAAIRAGFTTKYCNPQTRIAVIRVRHGPHVLVTTTIPCITAINKKPASFNTIYTGATIRQCFKFIMKHQQKHVDKSFVAFSKRKSAVKNDSEYEVQKAALLNVEPIFDFF